MTGEINKPKTIKDIADELVPSPSKVDEPTKDELLNKLTLAIILSTIAPTKEQSEEATQHAQKIIEMGLTKPEIEMCKRRANGRLLGGGNPLAGLDKVF